MIIYKKSTEYLGIKTNFANCHLSIGEIRFNSRILAVKSYFTFHAYGACPFLWQIMQSMGKVTPREAWAAVSLAWSWQAKQL